jgi:hypothetical protein
MNAELSPEELEQLLNTLHARFEKNRNPHAGVEWAKVKGELENNPGKLWLLS